MKKMVNGELVDLTEDELAERQARKQHFFHLEPYQFHAMLEIAGLTQTVSAAIDSITDPAERAVAKAKMERAQTFHRNDALIARFAMEIGLTDAQVDEMWKNAEQL